MSVTSWSGVATWDFATWAFGSGPTTWGDLSSWGDLGAWFVPDGTFGTMPSRASVLAFDPGSAGIGPVEYVSATMRPLSRLRASMLALPDDGPTVGPASVAASSVSTSVTLAPSSRFMSVTAVDEASMTLFLEPVASAPTVGMALIYSATEPDYPTPFLWVTPDGDFYLVEA